MSYTEYKIKNATVRIHGQINREKLEAALIKYVKEVMPYVECKATITSRNRAESNSEFKQSSLLP